MTGPEVFFGECYFISGLLLGGTEVSLAAKKLLLNA